MGLALCVHRSLVIEGSAAYEPNRSCIWPDFFAESLPSPELSLWRIEAPNLVSEDGEPISFGHNYFVAQPSFERPTFPVYALRNPNFGTLSSSKLPFTAHAHQHDPFDLGLLQEAVVLPSKVSKEEALKLYRTWVEGLWFAPANIRQQQFHEGLFEQVYLPYYAFDATMTSNYTAEERVPEASQTLEGAEWRNVETTHTTEHCDLLQPAFEEYELKELITEEFVGWALSEGVPTPMKELPAHLLPLAAPSERWPVCQHILFNREATAKKEAMSMSHLETRHIDVFSELTSVRFRMILVPILTTSFYHGGHKYHFVINAVTGATNGSRPYALWNGLGSLWQREEVPGVYSGSQLAGGKSSELFKDGLFYLVFPPSKRNLLTTEVGWIELQNNSSNPIKFQGKERNGKRVGIIYKLEAQQTLFFPYKGHW